MAINFRKKTSTHALIDKKKLKQYRNNSKIKEMDRIIGIEKVINDCVIKSKYGYSSIIKISTTDPEVLSEDDAEAFQDVLASFAFGLGFPLKFVRSSRKHNFKKYRMYIDKNEEEISNSEFLVNYKNLFYDELNGLESNGENTTSNYIIVATPKEAIEERSLKEVQDKINYILRSFQDSNFKLEIIKGKEIIEYMYSIFNRDRDIDIENYIKNGSFETVLGELGVKQTVHPKDSYNGKFVKLLDSKDYARIMLEEANELYKGDSKDKKTSKTKKKDKISEEEEDILEMGKYRIYDLIKPSVYEEKEDYIILGSGNYVRMLSIATLPQTLNVSTLNDLCRVVEDVEIVSYCNKINENSLSRDLQSRYNKLQSNLRIEYDQTGNIDYKKQEAAAQIDGIRRDIETNSDKLFKVQNLIKIWSDDLKDLENKTKNVINACAKIGAEAKVLFYDQKSAFMSSLPFYTMPFRENKRNVTVGGTSCLVPNGCTHLVHSEGKYIGRNIATRAPIIFDNYLCQKNWYKDSELYSNPNMYICGKPGSGKSSFMKIFMGRGILAGEWNVIFDMENEYRKICQKFGGKYIYLKAGEKIGLNPLEVSISEDEDGKKTIDIMDRVTDVVNLLNGFIEHYNKRSLNGTEIAEIQKAILRVYEDRGINKSPKSLYDKNGKKKKMPILSDLKQAIYDVGCEVEERNKKISSSLIEISETMEAITGNGLMNMFDCETSGDISNFKENKMVVFCLKYLDETSKFYAMTTILNWVWGFYSDWKYKGIQKNVWIDEGWVLAKHKSSLSLIENFSRRGRKYWIGLIISTQSITEFLNSKEGNAIVELCSTKVLFKQSSSLAKKIGEQFGIPINVQKQMPNFVKGECIFVTETGNAIIQVDMFGCEKEYSQT